jgi:uncharacterized protein (TIGR02246 family)
MFPALIAALEAGDVDAALRLYEPDAGFVTAAGELARGDAMRAELQAISNAKAVTKGAPIKTMIVGDLALVFVKYTGAIQLPDGKTFEADGLSTDVLRRQPDGTWLGVLDNPYGTALVEGQPIPQEIIDAAASG